MGKLNYLVLFFASVVLGGCFEVYESDLYENYKPTVVIEAKINNHELPYYVYVSHSADPNDTLDFYPTTEALIFLSDNEGNSERLQEVQPGTYIGNEIKGYPNNEYQLNVQVGAREYQAKEVMFDTAIIAKIEILYLDEFVPEEGKYIKLYIEKSDDFTQYYKLEVLKNDSLYNSYSDLVIFDDAYAEDTIEYLVPYAFYDGDSVAINLHVISSSVYKYYYELSKQTNNTISNIQAPMQNPTSNINNGALGCFMVSAVTQIGVVIE